MKKKWIIASLAIFFTTTMEAQDKYFTKSGKISFYSKATMENIEATNKAVTCVLDTKTGNLQFAVMMKAFEFDKSLMQEHFNENYVESHKFPKADFKGQVIGNGDVNYLKEGRYPVKVKGKLTMHGETRDVETTGYISIKGNKIVVDAVFNLSLMDYKISVPAVVKDNISKTVSISVDCLLDPLKS